MARKSKKEIPVEQAQEILEEIKQEGSAII
jgi:hypothetical protein